MAAQGDVTIVSTKHLRLKEATTPLPREGVVVMQAERGGHTHTLHGEGCLYDTIETDLHIGTLTVPEGREALLTHQEHGALLIGPGSYRIGGQREYAGEWRRVAD
ncbi:hypothetical protein [Nakamurella aerolata]|uniref:Uncharacterized protein n=1 Tax=Nakamurella aerolata TaxID=1656892 RepID=A0A849AB72_9ACTN|nr:hypothetical protein [Nakamurella aerolata]NNG36913.1 hypothetical protein [Nakamurella aerolata]